MRKVTKPMQVEIAWTPWTRWKQGNVSRLRSRTLKCGGLEMAKLTQFHVNRAPALPDDLGRIQMLRRAPFWVFANGKRVGELTEKRALEQVEILLEGQR